MNTANIIREVVSLPVEERALVVESLLASLNQPEFEIDAQWASLAQIRLSELQTKKLSTLDGDQVFNKIWQRFDK